MNLTYFRKKADTLDAQDPLKTYRELFAIPHNKIYLCHNSLGIPTQSSFKLVHDYMKNGLNLAHMAGLTVMITGTHHSTNHYANLYAHCLAHSMTKLL